MDIGMTTRHDPGQEDRAALEREAVAWVARLADGTREDVAALRRWQAQSAAHAEAFAKVSQIWRAMPEAIETIVRRGDVSPPVVLNKGIHTPSRRMVIGGLATAAAVGGGFMVARPPLDLWPSFSELAADYRTETGEQRRISVAGASVDMNTQTSIALMSGISGVDRFELIAGEAMVRVPANAGKPVQVIAAEGITTADTADFTVRRDGNSTSVTCLSGTVHVEYRNRAAALEQKQQLSYGESGISAAMLIDPAAVVAWRDGYLMFTREPLARVIVEVNRYRPGRIMLLNAELGRGVVTARFRLDRLDDVIVQVREVFGARVRTLPGGIVLLS